MNLDRIQIGDIARGLRARIDEARRLMSANGDRVQIAALRCEIDRLHELLASVDRAARIDIVERA